MKKQEEIGHLQRALFVQELLGWYDRAERDLPWRRTRDAYAIWISETMLQQTQVATVIPYWEKWLRRFPTVTDLAAAPIDDVLKHWQGLGYYARARNLHRAARKIVETHGGVFPANLNEVLALPGVGRYTAGAVLSIALGQDVPIVDANVIRVLCRVFGIGGDPKTPGVQRQLWQLADDLIPPGDARRFNQAMMELGALVCDAKKPRCQICPVRENCAAYQSGNPTRLPEFAPKPLVTVETHVCAILQNETGDVLLTQRFPDGLWGGLWEFPRVVLRDNETPEQGAIRAAGEIVGLTVTVGAQLAALKHGVTTRKIMLIGVEAVTAAPATMPQPLACAAVAWISPADLSRYALSSPQAKLAKLALAPITQPSLF